MSAVVCHKVTACHHEFWTLFWPCLWKQFCGQSRTLKWLSSLMTAPGAATLCVVWKVSWSCGADIVLGLVSKKTSIKASSLIETRLSGLEWSRTKTWRIMWLPICGHLELQWVLVPFFRKKKLELLRPETLLPRFGSHRFLQVCEPSLLLPRPVQKQLMDGWCVSQLLRTGKNWRLSCAGWDFAIEWQVRVLFVWCLGIHKTLNFKQVQRRLWLFGAYANTRLEFCVTGWFLRGLLPVSKLGYPLLVGL